MEQHWLILNPETFLFCESKKAFIYNSISGKGFVVYRKGKIDNLLNELSELDNLYCIEISQDILDEQGVRNFVDKLIETFSGNLIQKNKHDKKPIILPPFLNLQKDIDKLRKDNFRSVGESVSSYLNKITIYLDKFSENRNNISQEFSDTVLEIEPLKKFISKINYNSLDEIDLYSGSYLKYSQLKPFLEELFKYSFSVILNFPINSKIDLPDISDLYGSKEFKVRLIIRPEFSLEEVSNIINADGGNYTRELLFLVSSMNDFLNANTIIENNQELKSEIRPFYKNENLDFFEENVYLTEDEFVNIQTTKQEIFLRQAINTHDFGKLTITADKKVYANPNLLALGTIEDDINNLVYKEMDQGTSWRRTRDMEPCCDCVYQWLCPSPSHYELDIGKPNLCHVKP